MGNIYGNRMFISALTESQAIATIVTFAITVICSLISGLRDSIPQIIKQRGIYLQQYFTLL